MYKSTGKTHAKPILWGAPGSAYSGKTRSYFIKKGIAYEEIFPPHPRYQEEILPLIGYFVMPVVELPDGTLIQDTTDTIVHFEQVHPEPALIPSSPFHKAMATGGSNLRPSVTTWTNSCRIPGVTTSVRSGLSSCPSRLSTFLAYWTLAAASRILPPPRETQ